MGRMSHRSSSRVVRPTRITNPRPALGVDHLDQGLDVAECEGEGLLAAVVAVELGDMVRHQHAVVADFLGKCGWRGAC